MNNQKQDNTLSIVAIVIGGLSLVMSLIPCLFFLSIPLAVIGVILGLIAYFKARDNGDKKTLSIVALILSVLPLLISTIWYFTFSSMTDEIDMKYKSIQDCDSLKIEIEKTVLEIESIERSLENSEDGKGVFGNVAKITKLGIKMGEMQENAQDLGCDFNENTIEVDSIQNNIEPSQIDK